MMLRGIGHNTSRLFCKAATYCVAAILLVLPSLLSGCEGDSAVRQLSDYELAQRQAECIDQKPTAPGRAQACENVQRECDRRRKELGLYICR